MPLHSLLTAVIIIMFISVHLTYGIHAKLFICKQLNCSPHQASGWVIITNTYPWYLWPIFLKQMSNTDSFTTGHLLFSQSLCISDGQCLITVDQMIGPDRTD